MAAIGQVQFGQVRVIPDGSTTSNQFIENPGEEFIQDLSTARQQCMDMPTLRYPPPVSGIVEQHVSLDHHDGLEEIGEHSCSEQPAHARTQNDRTLTKYRHSKPPKLADTGSPRSAKPAIRPYQQINGRFREFAD